jgi:hypothetical protein
LLGGRDRIEISEIMKPLYSHFLKNKSMEMEPVTSKTLSGWPLLWSM